MKQLIFLSLLASIALADPGLSNILLDDEGWQQTAVTEQGFVIKERELPGYPMHAVSVTAEVNLPLETLAAVVHDIENYSRFLNSAAAITFDVFEKDSTHIIGYQHINIPYLSDRHYAYRFDLVGTREGQRWITGWDLLPANGRLTSFINQKDEQFENPVYIDEGSGRFIFERIGENRTRFSYRLYMDIGGWVPKSLVERSNSEGIVGLVADVIAEAQRRVSLPMPAESLTEG